jgi:hypothetical protein
MSDTSWPDLWVVPPEGSRYGFPRAFSFKASGPGISKSKAKSEFAAWFRAHGYPQKLMDEGMLDHCRFGPLRRDNEND